MVAKVTNCDITRCATCALIGCPTNIIRFRNNTEERSNGPPGVIIVGIIGGIPRLAATIALDLYI